MMTVHLISALVLCMASGFCFSQVLDKVSPALEDLGYYSQRIRAQINNFHQYEYDDFIGPVTTIWNGRFDMYSVGNEMSFFEKDREDSTVAEYGFTYPMERSLLSSAMIYPFTALWGFDEQSSNNQSTFEVQSFPGVNREALFQNFSGSLEHENYTLMYRVAQIYGSTTPSICEVFYLIANKQNWRSDLPEDFRVTSSGSHPFATTNTATLSGMYRNVLFGYSLYSKFQRGGTGEAVTESEVRNALKETLLIIITSDSPNRPSPPTPSKPFRPSSETMVEVIMRSLELVAKNITSKIPFWYDYEYDTADSVIEDGGNDIFDFGNRIRFKKNVELSTRAIYDQFYYFDDYQFLTKTIHPFFALMWIENGNGTNTTFTLQVDGNVGADQEGGINLYSGKEFVVGKFTFSYEVFHVHSTDDPSVVELYFTAHSSEAWNSSTSSRLEVVAFTDETDELVNSVRVVGRPQRSLLGYVLLSKTDGKIVTENEIRNVLSVMASGLEATAAQPNRLPSTTESQPQSTQAPQQVTPPKVEGSVQTTASLPSIAGQLVTAVEAITRSSSNITEILVPNWHQYVYDDDVQPVDSVHNGGNSMYMVGNQVTFTEDSKPAIAGTYNESYSSRNFDVVTSASRLFFGLMWIENPEAEEHTFQIKVDSTFGGSGFTREHGGFLSQTGMVCNYHVFQLYNTAPRPSVCEVYFTIESRRFWNSVPGVKLERNFTFDGKKASNFVLLKGSPQRLLLGYFLLSRNNGGNIPKSAVRQSFMVIVRQLVKIFSDNEQSSLPLSVAVVPPTSSTKTASHFSIDDAPADEDFLAGCTVKEATEAIWKCEKALQSPIKYYGVQSCVKTVNCIVDCVADQLDQCVAANGTNKLDSYNFSSFNSKLMMDTLRGLSKSAEGGSDAVTAFCYHAPWNLPFPRSLSQLAGCNLLYSSSLVKIVTDLYHKFIWAASSDEICSAVEEFKRLIIEESQQQCFSQADQGLKDVSQEKKEYLVRVMRVALKTLKNLTSVSCQGRRQSAEAGDISGSTANCCDAKQELDLPISCRVPANLTDKP